MIDGFIKAACGIPEIEVADCAVNRVRIREKIGELERLGARIMVLPELCITGYTCGDLFWQVSLLREAKEALLLLAEETKDVDALIFVGLPMEIYGKLFNVAAALKGGKVLGLIPKRNIPAYAEFYEGRHFAPGQEEVTEVLIGGEKVPFWDQQKFVC